MPQNKPYVKVIQEALKAGTQNVIFTFHATKQMKKRGITAGMVFSAIERGKTNRPPEFDIKTGAMKVELKDYCGKVEYSVVIAVIESEVFVNVVTAYKES